MCTILLKRQVNLQLTVNEKIRIAHVAAMQDHIDITLCLGGGSKVERKVVDASGIIEDNTFMDWELTYTDPEKNKCEQPE